MRTLILGLLLAAQAVAAPSVSKTRPKWTRAKPHFETRAQKRVAVAVGRAKAENLALARAAAEDKGRAALLRLIQGKGPAASAEGLVQGAHAAEFFDAGRDVVYVRMELEL